MKITTAEIAKRAGVSPATVSRVISGGNVSDEKRNAVLAVLNESAPQRIRPRKKRGSEICYIGMLILDTSGYGDLLGRSWEFRTVGYGHGKSLWNDMISTLKATGYEGVISIEHEDPLMSPKEGLEKAVAFLKDVIIFEDPDAMWWT